jgi:SAM-dependent methyltransferase
VSTIEQVEKFWDNRPCNVRHSKKTLGSREYFDEVEQRRYFVEPHIKEFADFEKWRGKEVLEIGCGIGTDTINFARAGASVTAIDLSPKSIEIAKQRAHVYGLENSIKFICGSAENLRDLVREKKYDLIYSFGVIHHTPNPESVFLQVQNHLKNDGEFRVMVYHKLSWRVLEILFESGNPLSGILDLDKTIATRSEAQTGCPVTYSYSLSSFKSLLERNGLTVTRGEIKHIFKWNVEKYITGFYDRKFYWKLVPAWLFEYLQQKFGWHLCVTAKSAN